MFNAHHEPLTFMLPEAKWGSSWAVLLDTAEDADHLSEDNPGPELEAARQRCRLQPWSLVLLEENDTAMKPRRFGNPAALHRRARQAARAERRRRCAQSAARCAGRARFAGQLAHAGGRTSAAPARGRRGPTMRAGRSS